MQRREFLRLAAVVAVTIVFPFRRRAAPEPGSDSNNEYHQPSERRYLRVLAGAGIPDIFDEGPSGHTAFGSLEERYFSADCDLLMSPHQHGWTGYRVAMGLAIHCRSMELCIWCSRSPWGSL